MTLYLSSLFIILVVGGAVSSTSRGRNRRLGGIGEPQAIEPQHIEFARFAVSQMGNQYEFNQVLTVRQQIVSGIMYHMDILVTKSVKQKRIQQICSVKVQHQPWLQEAERTLVGYRCRKAARL